MIGIYLSGTGNTKHCTEKLVHLLDKTAQAITLLGDTIIEQCRYDRYVNVNDPACNHGTHE